MDARRICEAKQNQLPYVFNDRVIPARETAWGTLHPFINDI